MKRALQSTTNVQKRKRRKRICQHPDGCSTPVNYKDGGLRNRCSRHGGFPLCQHPDGCSSSVAYKDGGLRNRCTRHGGYPLCQHPDGCSTPVQYKDGGLRGRCIRHGGYPDGCSTPVAYIDGGLRGRCRRHGGYPLCQHPDGCGTPAKYKDGGVRNRCSRHGGYPKCATCMQFSVSKVGQLCSDCDPKKRRRRKLKEDAIRDLLRKHDIRFEDEVKIDFECLVSSDLSRQTKGDKDMKKYCKIATGRTRSSSSRWTRCSTRPTFHPARAVASCRYSSRNCVPTGSPAATGTSTRLWTPSQTWSAGTGRGRSWLWCDTTPTHSGGQGRWCRFRRR